MGDRLDMAQRDNRGLNALMGLAVMAFGAGTVVTANRVQDDAFWGLLVSVMVLEWMAFQIGKQYERERHK